MTTSPPRCRSLFALVALLVLASLSPAAAQEIRGRVVEAGTQRGVEGVLLQLVDAGEEPVARARSDRAGVYLLRAPGPGLYRVRAERVGYGVTLSDAVDLADGATTQLLLPLTAEAVAVAAMTVTAQREERPAELTSRGFYERKEAGFGSFMERAEIEQRNPSTASQMLTGIRGVRVVQMDDEGRRDVRLGRLEQECMPTVWVDGRKVRDGGRSDHMQRRASGAEPVLGDGLLPLASLDDLVDPDHVEAVEVYHGSAGTPPQFAGSGDRCGVIVVWTRKS